MKKLTEFAIVVSVLCLLCGSTPRLAVAETRAVWTGGGENNDVLNPDNWSWLEGPTPEGYPDDDTDVILDHTAVDTTLGIYDHPRPSLDFNSVAVGDGTDRVTYSIVSYTDVAEILAGTGWFSVNDRATVEFKNIGMYDLHLLPGSTLRVEEDGHLVRYGGAGQGRLSLEGNLELVLPAEPSGEYVIAEYGRLTGQFASVAGLPSGWRIDYGSGTDDYIRAVPEPSSFALLAAGTLGLAAYAWRRRRQRRGPQQLFSIQRTSIMRSVTLSLAVLVSVGVGQVQAASIHPLGDSGGISFAKPYGVSNNGLVVGERSDSEAFRWTQAEGMVSLGVGGAESCAYGVSADGSVVVGSRWSPAKSLEAFRWTQLSGTAVLPGAPGDARADAVSADGSVVVGWVSERASRWTEDTGLLDLGCLGDDWLSYAHDVSADGSVVVGRNGCCGDEKAFRWTEPGGMVALPGGIQDARGVSADGSVVVGEGWVDPGGPWVPWGWHAFRWTQATGSVDLGHLPGDPDRGYFPNDVSGDGSVVVGVGDATAGDQVAFIWDADHGMRRLQDVLTVEYGLDLTGWDLTHATAISDNGLHIVGYGKRTGGHHEAWLATIPEPSSFALLATGVLVLLVCAWRRRRE